MKTPLHMSRVAQQLIARVACRQRRWRASGRRTYSLVLIAASARRQTFMATSRFSEHGRHIAALGLINSCKLPHASYSSRRRKPRAAMKTAHSKTCAVNSSLGATALQRALRRRSKSAGLTAWQAYDAAGSRCQQAARIFARTAISASLLLKHS